MMKKMLFLLTLVFGVGTAQGQAVLNGTPNPDFTNLHAWYDVNQSLNIWEGRTDQYDDEFLVDVRDTATGTGASRGESYPTNLETWAQFDESGGTFWTQRVGGFTGERNGMTTWEIRNGTGFDDGGGWTDADGVGTVGIGALDTTDIQGFTVMLAMNVLEIKSYNSVWNGDPVQANDDTPILNGNTGMFNEGATDQPQPGKGLLWLDSVRTGEAGPVFVMDGDGTEFVAGDVTLDQWQVHTFEFNVGDNEVANHYIDGTLAATGDAGFADMPSLDFFGSDGGWHRGGDIDFGEGLFFDGTLSADDRSGLESYLAAKWVNESGTVDGDFNDDTSYDCADADALSNEISAGTNNSDFDLSGDGLVNTDDLDAWLTEAGAAEQVSGEPYSLGDVTLDGSVDSGDLGVLLNNFDSTGIAYCGGNLNGDTIVDSTDLGSLLNNFAPAGANAAAVPEPTGSLLALVSLLGVLVIRRKR